MKICVPLLALSTFYLCLHPLRTVAQTGPGGVGDAATNKVWLDASRLTGFNNGGKVNQWADASGNNWHGVQGSMVNQPTYVANGLNNKPVVNFNRTQGNQFFDITNAGIGTDVMSNSNTIMTVVRINSAGVNNYQAIAVQQGFHTGLTTYGPTGAEGIATSQYVGGTVSAPATGSNNSFVSFGGSTPPGSWNMAAMQNSETAAGTTVSLFINGSPNGQQSSPRQMSTFAFNLFRVGAAQPSGLWHGGLNGDIAEVILYNVSLNSAKRIIVENYLSAKYNLPIANKYYSDNTHYNQDVQGIGTTDGVSKHSQAASGKGLVLTEANGSLDASNEFVFAGHNSSANALVNADPGSTGGQRWQRSWLVHKTGTLDAKLSFDWSQAGLVPTNLAAELSRYCLLYRPDLQSSFRPVSADNAPLVPVLENTDQLSFTLSNATLQNGYYTLGKLDTFVWTGAVSSDWHLAGNWSGNSMPAAGDHAVVPACTTCPVLSAPVQVGSLLVEEGQLDVRNFTVSAAAATRLISARIRSNGGTLQAASLGEVKGCNFEGNIVFRKTGSTDDAWYGDNAYRGKVTVLNSGTGGIAAAAQANDVIVE